MWVISFSKNVNYKIKSDISGVYIWCIIVRYCYNTTMVWGHQCSEKSKFYTEKVYNCHKLQVSVVCFCISELKCKHERCLRALWNQFYFRDLSLHYCVEWHIWSKCTLFQQNKPTNMHWYEANIHFVHKRKCECFFFVIKNICCVFSEHKAFSIYFVQCLRCKIEEFQFLSHIMILEIVKHFK